MSGPTSGTYISQRLRLHYVDWGNPDAPPLLLIHGGRDHCRNWDWVAERLRRSWHVIAPDLRGHGDSQWTNDGSYTIAGYLYDLAQLIRQLDLASVTIIGHSLGGNIALRYSGIFPEQVKRLVAIEGLGPSPKVIAERALKTVDQRVRDWIDEHRGLSRYQPRRYPTLEAAYERMQSANAHLSRERAWHLTRYGVMQNEDGTYSWKFDDYVRLWPPYDMTRDEIQSLWSRITCPTLLVYGEDSWASNPAQDGRNVHFQNARVASFAKAGHWVHHDQLDQFLDETERFLAE